MNERRATGWAVVSGILLSLAGLNTLLNGLWALHASTAIQSSLHGKLLFSDDNIDTWGWIYVIVGAVIFISGLAVFGRATWARWVGVIAAFASMVASFFWLFTPYWQSAMVSIVLAGLVVYGLGTYGEPAEWRNRWVESEKQG